MGEACCRKEVFLVAREANFYESANEHVLCYVGMSHGFEREAHGKSQL